jgi:hypothetical protein
MSRYLVYLRSPIEEEIIFTMAFYTAVDSTRKYRLGTRIKDSAGNEFIYLKGVTSTAQGSWVSFDEVHVTTLLAANAVGRVAVAQAAVDASTKYGWYCIYGKTSAKVLASFADNGKIFSTSTAGSVDDAVVTGDLVVGAIGRSAVDGGSSTGQAYVELSYPFATDVLG